MTLALLLTSVAALIAALVLGRTQRRRRIRGERPAIVMRQLQARIAVLREELATERMRVVACGAAANGIRTPESSPYWSPSHADVCRLADRAAAQATLLAAIGDASCAFPAQAADHFGARTFELSSGPALMCAKRTDAEGRLLQRMVRPGAEARK